jgi:hypothetical protein
MERPPLEDAEALIPQEQQQRENNVTPKVSQGFRIRFVLIGIMVRLLIQGLIFGISLRRRKKILNPKVTRFFCTTALSTLPRGLLDWPYFCLLNVAACTLEMRLSFMDPCQ